VASAAAQASTIKTTAVIAPSTYVATAAAQAPVFSATRTIAASTYSASAAAQLPTLTASAIVPASTYTSTAAGQLPAPKTTATVAPATYIATAAGQPPGIGAPGIIAVPTYTATAAAQLPILWLNSPASIATNWVTWTATATAVVGHTATIVSNWTTGAQLTELFNGGADGVAISTVNTPYFTFVSGAIEFDTGFTYKVSQSMRVPSSAVAAYGRHDGMNAAAISASIYVRFASVAPAASSIFMVFRDSLNAQSVSLLLSTASRIVAQDSASAPIAATNIATHAVVANNTYRVDVLVNKGAGTGRLQYRICDVNTADTNTPITTPYDSGATLQLNANNIDRIGVGGVVNGSARNGDWNIGIVRTDESRSTFFDAYLYPNLTATATVEHAASIADNWGTWAAFAAAIPLCRGPSVTTGAPGPPSPTGMSPTVRRWPRARTQRPLPLRLQPSRLRPLSQRRRTPLQRRLRLRFRRRQQALLRRPTQRRRQHSLRRRRHPPPW
jgi:hypothetical protein